MPKEPLVSAETNIGSKKTRAKSQYNYDQVLSHASGLTFEERAELCKEIKRQLAGEVSARKTKVTLAEEDLKEAEQIITGL